MLAETIDRLLSVGYQRAGLEAPRLWPAERRNIARTARNRAGLPDDASPKQIARALGMVVQCIPVRGCGGELTDGTRIVYRWHPDARTRRIRVAHGLAHALLVAGGYEHTETDALLLTLDFL